MNLLVKYFPHLNQKQIRQFAALKNLYVEWNEKINVISRKDLDNFYERHVLHSLAIAKIFSFPDGYNIMDLGSGGGLPGIPLAILFPGVKFHLVDSIKKKMKVANEIAHDIGLINITTQQVRVEEIRDQQYDIVLSRAVAPLKELVRWSKPLLELPVAGYRLAANGLICLKGGDLTEEIGESGVVPKIYAIDKIFEEDFFKEKYILHVRQQV